MKEIRVGRLQEEILREVGEILERRLADPRLGLATVTRVEVTGDLGHARIYVSFLGEEDSVEPRLRVLARAAGFIRGELARRLKMRRIPELEFRPDVGIRTSARIQSLLAELHLDEAAGGSPPESDERGKAGEDPSNPDGTPSGPGAGPASSGPGRSLRE